MSTLAHRRPHENPLTVTDEARFWSKTDRTGECWVWLGGRDRVGYGRFKLNGRRPTAHRIAYTIANGDPGVLVVHHTCFRRECVNPRHLAAVTQARNVQMKDGAHANNLSTGVRNVSPNGRRWKVQIGADGQRHHIGTFDTVEEATAVAERERLRLHGEYVAPSGAAVSEEYIRSITQRAEAEARRCRLGHERDPDKPCKECHRAAQRRHYERSRAA